MLLVSLLPPQARLQSCSCPASQSLSLLLFVCCCCWKVRYVAWCITRSSHRPFSFVVEPTGFIVVPPLHSKPALAVVFICVHVGAAWQVSLMDISAGNSFASPHVCMFACRFAVFAGCMHVLCFVCCGVVCQHSLFARSSTLILYDAHSRLYSNTTHTSLY